MMEAAAKKSLATTSSVYKADYYGVTVFFHDEKTVDFDVASHVIKDGFLEIATHNDEWNIIPMTSIKRLQFDKQFSKIVALRSEAKEDASNS